MALIHCEKCGEMYADTYKACPFCAEDEAYYKGRVKKKVKRKVEKKNKMPSIIGPAMVVVVFLLAGVLLWTFFGSAITGTIHVKDFDKGEEIKQEDKKEEQPTVTPVELVSLDRSAVQLKVGEETTLVASGGQYYIWSSANPGICSVTEDGKITAISAGEEGSAKTTIYVEDENGNKDVCSVTVVAEDYDPNAKEGGETTENPNGNTTGGNTSGGNTTKPKNLSGYGVSTEYGTELPKYWIDGEEADGHFEVSMGTGEAFTLKITGTTGKVVWSSDHPEIVSVTSDGKIKKEASGSAVVSAKVDGIELQIHAHNQ